MARGLTNRLYRNFTKGLITESSLLTYPENSCNDLDNCIIYRKGNISRRFGADYEENWTTSPYTVNEADNNVTALKEYKWESVANRSTINFLVVQTGITLRFYDMNTQTLGTSLKTFSFDMTPYLAPNTTVAQGVDCEISFASGKGYLFVTGEKFEPIIIEYLPALDAITVARIYIQVRDFQGVDDGLANDDEPTTLSATHNYNLLNQGWYAAANNASGSTVSYFSPFGVLDFHVAPAQTPITNYFTETSRYPGNNKQWWVAKDNTTGDFDPELLTKFNFGSGRAPRGHFILDAFNKDRSAMSGILGLPVETTNSRPVSVAFFSGRVWYLADQVYYSQILDNKAKAGLCYQEADPTSEDFSDLVASDGGSIPIPEMAKGVRLLPAAGGILVFATNGIWFISGTAGGFSAVDISSTRVSPIGTSNPNTIVDSKDGIFWWGKVGIQKLVVESGAGGTSFDNNTVSEETIQGFYNDISSESKRWAKGVYDPATNTIQWLFNSVDTERYKFNRILNLDLTLGSFYPWTIAGDGPSIMGVFITPELNEVNSPYETSIRDNYIKYLVALPQGGLHYFTFGFFKNYRFADWPTWESPGFEYLSYLESGYELLDDAMRKKELNYVFCYFRKTEENYSQGVLMNETVLEAINLYLSQVNPSRLGGNTLPIRDFNQAIVVTSNVYLGNYVPDGLDYTVGNPSSCLLQIKWDWASGSNSGKWTTAVEAYRHQRLPAVDITDLSFNTGFPVVISRNKIRGHGKALQFRFESNGSGNDFDLLGWSVPISGNTNP